MIRAVAGTLLWLAACGVALADEPQVELAFPADRATVGAPDARGFIAGRATSAEARELDVVLAIDTSDSVSEVSSDGRRDSNLVGEVRAARAFVAALDLRTTRAGIVSFAGDVDPVTPDAYTEVPLTGDPAALEHALHRLERSSGKGMTNLVSAIDLATIELVGTAHAKSTPRAGARRVIIVLTDEEGPTLPVDNGAWRNATLAIQQAERSAKLGVRIDVYAFGALPAEKRVVGAELAKASGGVFVPVARAADLAGALSAANLSGVEKLEITNRTTGQPASVVLRRPDGFFAALVPLRVGENAVEVRGPPAGERTLNLTYDGSASDDLPVDLRALRSALLGTVTVKEP